MTVPNPAEADVPVVASKRRGRLLVRVVIALIILAAMAYAGRRYFGELDRLKSANPWIVVMMAALYVAARLPPAALLRRALRALGHHIGRAEAFFVLMVQYYVNMLIPRAGIGALAGLGIDALIHGEVVVYTASPPVSRRGVTVAPLAARGRSGVRLTIAF